LQGRFSAKGLQTFFSHSPKVQRFCLKNIPLSPDVIPIIIAHCPNLRHLELSNNEWWTASSLCLLARSSLRLESLDLGLSLVSLEPIALLIKKMPSILELKTSQHTPVEVTLMIMREIDLKCLLSSDPEVQLKGLRSICDRIPDQIDRPSGSLSPREMTLRSLAQMDVALRRLVDLLSHDHKEVWHSLHTILSLLLR
jgi:hypothetical protein